MGFPTLGRPLLNYMKAPDGLSYPRLYPPCLIFVSTTKNTKFLSMFIFLSHSTLKSSTHMNWKLSRCFDLLTCNGKEANAPLQCHWNHAFNYHHCFLFHKDPKYKNLQHTQRLLKLAKTQDELSLIYAILAGNAGG